MKVGSVVILKDPGYVGELLKPLSRKDHYTVRGVYHSQHTSRGCGTIVLLDGIFNGRSYYGSEMGYSIEALAEIEFPEDLMSQVTEALDRELVLADKTTTK